MHLLFYSDVGVSLVANWASEGLLDFSFFHLRFLVFRNLLLNENIYTSLVEAMVVLQVPLLTVKYN